ncbi:D-2-hydroxyacid dehydrogenase family protein [Loktanella sp. M215]|uniref:D-2-hydroxyacid dehydrogenase family protein n=1 Tax=Loktanella sp. M215 TaxID=2675431 RepID=UPI001F299A07|nr:D-2-hydroxyacid dehydrogenase family protein [Loktanella sp. M215]MCF7701783.1 D-2-hydroxyacid dehydrogenase family protein [Loktanella sp. M215]
MTKVVILDDYQHVARDMVDWSSVEARCQIEVLHEHIADRAALAARLAGAEVVVAMRERTVFDACMLDRLPDLRLLITTGMVNKSIDIAAAHARGVTVCGTPGGGPSAAELAFGLILALARRIPQEADGLRNGDPQWQTGLGVDLAGKVLGIVGFGRLGMMMVRYGTAFGMDCVAWSRSLTKEDATSQGIRRADSLEDLLSQSDFVTLHLPLTPATTGVIGRAQLDLMKPSAFLVNTSRGPLVEEAALLDALETGAIRGAGLDVYDIEPLSTGHPYRSAPGLIAVPHIGYVTEDTYRNYFTGAVDAIIGWLDGAPVRVLAP